MTDSIQEQSTLVKENARLVGELIALINQCAKWKNLAGDRLQGWNNCVADKECLRRQIAALESELRQSRQELGGVRIERDNEHEKVLGLEQKHDDISKIAAQEHEIVLKQKEEIERLKSAPPIDARTLLAGMAMQGCLAYSHVNPMHGNYHENCDAERVALAAEGYADALLAELAKRKDA